MQIYEILADKKVVIRNKEHRAMLILQIWDNKYCKVHKYNHHGSNLCRICKKLDRNRRDNK